MKTMLYIGGPKSGDVVPYEGPPLEGEYSFWAIFNHAYAVYHEHATWESAMHALDYGYEQHCKHVAERNSFEATFRNQMRHQKEVQDEFTASFLKSCKLVVIPNPFGEHQPITLSYGKHHLGHLNDQMEFVMTVVNCDHGSTEKQEMNRGRIGTPIVVIP